VPRSRAVFQRGPFCPRPCGWGAHRSGSDDGFPPASEQCNPGPCPWPGHGLDCFLRRGELTTLPPSILFPTIPSRLLGAETSSGGEDGDHHGHNHKGRRKPKKDYASWASGCTAAAHHHHNHNGVGRPPHCPSLPPSSQASAQCHFGPTSPPSPFEPLVRPTRFAQS